VSEAAEVSQVVFSMRTLAPEWLYCGNCLPEAIASPKKISTGSSIISNELRVCYYHLLWIIYRLYGQFEENGIF